MNKIFLWGNLKFKLILSLIFSLTLSLVLFLLFQATGEDILERYLTKTSFIEKQEQLTISEFEKYVSENNLTLNDHDKIAKWIRETKYVNVYIYKDNKLIYATDGYTTATEDSGLLLNPHLRSDPQFSYIQFSDAEVQIYMECFFEYKYYYIVTISGVVISFLFFIVIMLFFINKKTSYIGVLENEIKILEGGDLTYRITIKGNDELSSLAQSINEMRKSFIERLENEEQARIANSDLVTAMSHDLRTPLTALVGYLDIIHFKKYQTDEAFNKYIHNSREKAYQIKHLSDKLFEYFTVFNTEDNDLEYEQFDGIQLIGQLIDEQLLLLDNNGFQFELTPYNIPFHMDVHLISIRRVLDNLFSNIIKYADKLKPVKINYDVKDDLLFINIENAVIKEAANVSSTGIGMKTCQKIIEKHKGQIAVTSTKEFYSIQISLPLRRPTHDGKLTPID
ncbi:sensor histidine kinase [Paenibacillus lentus]|uniref:histidine kinase n=1 Tax=Paenibacillus lentus TaxID=1338368 RepID=A0A3Q8S9P1_9BACL|nr:HAMP domain-containing sensor histidine kinase [Paenibacillus lentus]AZK45648.1 sensor histidine kinase [Paenibacillus lentus]